MRVLLVMFSMASVACQTRWYYGANLVQTFYSGDVLPPNCNEGNPPWNQGWCGCTVSSGQCRRTESLFRQGTWIIYSVCSTQYCSTGQYASVGCSQCQSCGPGTYANTQPAPVSCTSCEVGKAQPQYGQVSCVFCLPGQYSSGTGATFCSGELVRDLLHGIIVFTKTNAASCAHYASQSIFTLVVDQSLCLQAWARPRLARL